MLDHSHTTQESPKRLVTESAPGELQSLHLDGSTLVSCSFSNVAGSYAESAPPILTSSQHPPVHRPPPAAAGRSPQDTIAWLNDQDGPPYFTLGFVPCEANRQEAVNCSLRDGPQVDLTQDIEAIMDGDMDRVPKGNTIHDQTITFSDAGATRSQQSTRK